MISKKSKVAYSILALLLFLNATYIYMNKGITSGFFIYRRLPHLLLWEQNRGTMDLEPYTSFPFSPILLGTLQTITGESILTIIYYPYHLVVPFLYYYVFARYIFKKKSMSILMALSVFIFHFGTQAHYMEYPTGKVLFPLFIIISYKYYLNGDNRYFITSSMIFLVMKFFSPHAEVWAISFIAIIYIGLLIGMFSVSKRENNVWSLENYPTSHVRNYVILLLVVLLSYNPKIIEGLFSRLLIDPIEENPVSYFYSFALQLGRSSQDVRYEFGASPFSPTIPRSLTIIYVLLVIIGIGVPFLLILQRSLSNEFSLSKIKNKDILMLAGFLALVPDTFVGAYVGRISMELFVIVGPLISIYFVMRLKSYGVSRSRTRRAVYVLFIMFFLIAMISLPLHHWYGLTSSIGNQEENKNMGAWVEQHNINKEINQEHDRILTDINTFGLLRVNLASNGIQPDRTHYVRFDDKYYRHVIGDEMESNSVNYDYFILNKNYFDEALQRDWIYFEPLGRYKTEIDSNENMNKKYDSSSFSIYS